MRKIFFCPTCKNHIATDMPAWQYITIQILCTRCGDAYQTE